jgi:hypothetical protein
VARAGGGLLAMVGVYVTGYAAYLLTTTGPAATPGDGAPAPIAWVTRLSGELSQLLASPAGRAAMGVVVVLVVLVAAVMALGWLRARARPADTPAPVPAGDDQEGGGE